MSEYTEAREKVKSYIMAHADQLDMYGWFSGDGSKLEYTTHVCGTYACIGGGDTVLSSDEWKIVIDEDGYPLAMHTSGRVEKIPDAAREILGTTDLDLFHLDGWPAFISREYHQRLGGKEAEAACKAIDYFCELEDSNNDTNGSN